MEAPNTESNALNLNGLSYQDRKARLYDLVKGFPHFVPYSERMHTVAAQTGITPKTLYQLAKRNGWQARLAAEVAAEQERAEYNKRLEAAAPLHTDVSPLQVRDRIKGVIWTLLGASKRYIDVCAMMLTFYSDKIALRIAEAGGIAHLDAVATKDIAELQSKLAYYAKQLQPYFTPGPVATLLATIDFTNRLPLTDDAIEYQHFTAHALQQRLLELGMMSGTNPVAATADYGPLPILSGWANEHDNSEVKYYQGEIPDDLI